MWPRTSRRSRRVLWPALAGSLCGALCLSFAACTQPDEPPAPPSSQAPAEAAARSAEDAGHEHTAPHGGALVELGDEFAHVEIVLDAAAGTITAYVLDGEAEQAVRIAQATLAVVLDAPAGLANRPLELVPRASVLTGERVGDASEFVFSHEGLRGVRRVTGRVLTMAVRGQTFHETPFSAEASEEASAASTR